MNAWILILTSAMTWVYGGSEPLNHREANQALQRVYDVVVLEDGTIDYATLHSRNDLQRDLKAYVAFLATLSPDHLKDDLQRIAVYSNAYNAFTLLGVHRAWPVESVRKIRPLFGFFTKDEWVLGGEKMSLNDLEKKRLQPLDPRIHFTINCASASCPDLLPTVFTRDTIAAAMERATVMFLKDSSKNRFEDGTWYLSEIFKWYRDDWGNEADVVAFIRKYRPELAAPKKIKYLDYDWALNGPTEIE